MLGSYLITEAFLRLVEVAVNAALRAMGGPDHAPRRNEDFVWF